MTITTRQAVGLMLSAQGGAEILMAAFNGLPSVSGGVSFVIIGFITFVWKDIFA